MVGMCCRRSEITVTAEEIPDELRLARDGWMVGGFVIEELLMMARR